MCAVWLSTAPEKQAENYGSIRDGFFFLFSHILIPTAVSPPSSALFLPLTSFLPQLHPPLPPLRKRAGLPGTPTKYSKTSYTKARRWGLDLPGLVQFLETDISA